MIHGVHIEVILAGSYALLLVGVAVILEIVARHRTTARNISAIPVSPIKRTWMFGNVPPATI